MIVDTLSFHQETFMPYLHIHIYTRGIGGRYVQNFYKNECMAEQNL